MAGQDLTAFDSMLKEFYGVDTVTDLIKQKAPFLFKFKKSKLVSSDGRRVIAPLRSGRNVGVGARGEGGVLPTAGKQGYKSLTIGYKYNHARIQLTIQTIKQSRTSEGAFEHAVDSEIEGAVKDLGRDVSRQMMGFGRGDLCHISDTDASATHSLINGQGVADNDDTPGRFLRAGMLVAAIKADGTVDFIREVSSVGSDLKTVVFTATATPAEANEKLVRASTSAGTAAADVGYNNEMMGLLGMVDDSTYVDAYFGITRSTAGNEKLKAYRLDLGQGALTLDRLQQAFDGVDQQSDGYPDVMVANHITRREYLALLQAYKRFTNERALSPDGGFKGAAIRAEITFNEVPMMVDRDCPLGIIFGLTMASFWRFMLTEGEWADEDGTVMLRLSTTDDYEGRYRIFGNVACLAPNENFVVSSIKLNTTPEAISVAD